MTCQFYLVDRRPFCALGEPDGRHCGPRQYPRSSCNLDEIGEWGAWRAVCGNIEKWAAIVMEEPRHEWPYHIRIQSRIRRLLGAVGWSP